MGMTTDYTVTMVPEIIELKPALLIVDLQLDFCPGGTLPVENGDQIVKPLNKMLAYAHNNNVPVFVSRDWHSLESKHFKPHGDWPPHCVQNTRGAEFHPDLKIISGDYIVSKGTNPEDMKGYSAFEGTTYHAPLKEVLDYFKIKILYIGGLATDYCIKATCLDAKKLDYTVYLLTDACRAVNIKLTDEADAIEEMKKAGVIFTTTDKVLSQSR